MFAVDTALTRAKGHLSLSPADLSDEGPSSLAAGSPPSELPAGPSLRPAATASPEEAAGGGRVQDGGAATRCRVQEGSPSPPLALSQGLWTPSDPGPVTLTPPPVPS